MCHPAPPQASIEYVGHGTVLVDLAGVKLLTDPLLRNRVTHLRRAAKVDAGVAPRRRRGADLAPALRPPGHALAAAPRPGDARRGAEGCGRADQAPGRRHERHRDARRRGDPDRRPDRARRSRRARHRPAAVRRPRRAARLRDRGRRPLRLLRGRHRRLPGHGGARAGGCRAAPDLGLGADDGAGPHGSGPRRRGGRAARGATRDPDPLGHVLPRPPRAAGAARHSSGRRRRCSSRRCGSTSPATEVRVLQPGERTAI